MARMVPVVFVYVDGDDGEALYVDGYCEEQSPGSLSAMTVLRALDGILFSYGAGSVTREGLSETGRFPPRLSDIPRQAWVHEDFPEPCEHCDSFHEDGL